MSTNVNPKIGSGHQQFYHDNAGKNHGVAELVAIANWENQSSAISGRVSTVLIPVAGGNTVTQIPTSGNMPFRRQISIINAAGPTIYLGFGLGITSGNGYPLLPGTEKTLPLAATVDIYASGSLGGSILSILEIG